MLKPIYREKTSGRTPQIRNLPVVQVQHHRGLHGRHRRLDPSGTPEAALLRDEVIGHQTSISAGCGVKDDVTEVRRATSAAAAGQLLKHRDRRLIETFEMVEAEDLMGGPLHQGRRARSR